jgi:hypothetical protein
MNKILLSLSLGINLLLTSIVVQILLNIPYNMDQIRNDYLKDVKMFYQRGCVDGTFYPQEFKEQNIGWNENSPVNWCQKEKDAMEDIFGSTLYKLGRKK